MTPESRPRRILSVRIRARLDWLRSRLWFIPGTFAGGAVLGALILVPVDRRVDGHMVGEVSSLMFSGGPDSARLVLSTISAAMLTFTGLVFSLTMLVLQQASSQLSPRVMRTFLRDRVNQTVLGLFVATFLYSLLILREVRTPAAGSPFVPLIAVSVSYLLLVTSVGAFVFYIHHMAQAIRAISVLRSVANETRTAISRLYPEGIGDEPEATPPSHPARPPDWVVVLEGESGVITSVDDGRLVRLAREDELTIEFLHMVGDFVPQGAPLLRIWSRASGDSPAEPPPGGLKNAIQVGPERTMTQDTSFGFRQIVDIAARALSPGINDPTTALQALDQLHDLLRRLAIRQLPSPSRLDEDGVVLLHLPRPDWADYVSLALDEIRQYGGNSIQIARRLRYLLLDLQAVAPPFRQEPILRQMRLLEAGLTESFTLGEDRQAAAQPSPSGQGPSESPAPPVSPDGPTATVGDLEPRPKA